MRQLLIPGLLLSACGLAGCGGGGIETAVVEGIVLMEGQPVYPGRITFAPIGEEGVFETGRPASVVTDVDGSYRIEKAIVGTNKVSVAFEPTDRDAEEVEDSEMNIPTVGTPSEESYTVEPGTNQIDIKLATATPRTRPGRPGRADDD